MPSNKELLGEFLDEVWGTGTKPRRVCLAYKPLPNKFDVPPTQTWPKSRENILEFIMGISAKGQTPYFGPAMRTPDAVSNDKEYVLASWVLWCDFDGNAADALVRLKATPDLPRPTWRLQSGLPGHEHWYWVLDAPRGPQDFEPVNQKLAYYLEADKGCWNSNRVMRPPYTTNYMDAKKYDGRTLEPMPIDFLEKNDARYSLSDFDFLPAVNVSIRENLSEIGDIPPVISVLAKYLWDEKHLDMFNNPSTDKGARSDLMVRLAYFGAEQGMTDAEIYAVINDVDIRVGKFVGRKDRERRLAEMIQRVRIKHPYSTEFKFTDTNEEVKLAYTFNELRHSEFKLEWLVPNLLVARTSNFITAKSGAGKSRFTLQLAKALAGGTQFLKWPIERRIKCVYLSLEMQGDMLQHFINQLSHDKDLDQETSDNFILIPLGKELDLAKPESYAFLQMIVDMYKPEVLMVDAVGKLTPGDLEGPESKNINNKLNQLIADNAITFFLIHHNRKDDNKSESRRPSLSDVYGNGYILTDASTVLILWDKEENQTNVELIFAKTRASVKQDSIMLNGRKDFSFSIKEKEDEDAGYGPEDPSPLNFNY